MKSIQIIDSSIVQPVEEGIFTYSAWPSITMAADGHLVAAYSGSRIAHVCAFGREYVRHSYDEGKTWTNPIVVYNSPLDDRDAGVVTMPSGELGLSFFTLSKSDYMSEYYKDKQSREAVFGKAYLEMLPDNVDEDFSGRWITFSCDNGYTWDPPIRCPAFTPGGFKTINDGSFLYASQRSIEDCSKGNQHISVYRSDDARQWELYSIIPVCNDSKGLNHWEPEILQMSDGRILCMIRMENSGAKTEDEHVFTLASCYSNDLGKSWSVPQLLHCDGAPAGLLMHSSGRVVCVYASRKKPYGIKAMISGDFGKTWDIDIPLVTPPKDDIESGSHADLGYPKSVELKNGDIYTVFYSKEKNSSKCGIHGIRWRI